MKAMKNKLKDYIQATPEELLDGKDFKFIDNGANVLCVCHCDTVFDEDPKCNFYFENKEIGFSPKLDDRLGIWAAMEYLPQFMNFDILLTNDEEKGRSTAKLFKTKKQYNWMFELDRRGTDVVTYHYESNFLHKKLSKHFKTIGSGSFSDISELDFLGCKGFNVGIAYYNEHNIDSYVNWEEFYKQMESLVSFYLENKELHLEHNEEEIEEVEERDCIICKFQLEEHEMYVCEDCNLRDYEDDLWGM